MKRVAIIAALPGELQPLVKGWKRIASTRNIHHCEHPAVQKNGQPVTWIAVCAGIGRDAATRAFAAAEQAAPLDALISIGWAGSLTIATLPGTVLSAAWVIDSQTGERFDLVTTRDFSPTATGLVSTTRVAGVAEKARLAAAYPGAKLVDMETAAVARLASTRGIPAYCFKGISDGFTESLPDLNPFIDAQGQFHTARFIITAALRPRYWKALSIFGTNSKKAAQALSEAVRSLIEDFS